MTSANAAVDDPLIGTRIDGRYTVHRVLGQGGMGVVYEGVHDELGRSVAIKVLNAAWATDRTAVERFLREARTASSFSHGNIVDVSDLGRLADGRPYLVMPKINGTDLSTLLAESGPQPAKRVAALLAGVAAALDLVHAKGFVHRDIKPENLMFVTREDGSETVMLLDFGIAAAVMSSGPRLTRQGSIFGTPHYLPPEVCAGQRSDARGDVYALAAVAFELITGALPFPIEDIMQLMAVKVTQDAPSLALASGQSFPPEVEAVIARGMARDPNQRYASASAFVNALRAATEYAPVSWQSGVLRPNMRSSEHVLPQLGAAHHPSHAPMTRAPTMPAQAPRAGFLDERSYPRHPSQHPFDERSHPSYPRHPSQQGFDDGYGSYRSQPSHPHPQYSREQSYPQPGYPPQAQPPYRTNEGVWGMHAGGYTSEQAGRLRMSEERQFRTAPVPRRSSAGKFLMLALLLGGAGYGASQLLAARAEHEHAQARAITDARSATESPVPQTPPGEVARPTANAALPSTPAQVRPAPSPSRAAPSESARVEAPAAKAPEPVAQPAVAPSEPSAAAPQAPAPSSPVAAPQAERPRAASEPSQPRVAASAPRSTPRAREQALPDVPEPEPAAAPSLPAPAAQVVTLTPQAPAAEPAPQIDTLSASALARDSGSALLRGEVSKAVDLARRATQADPGYAGGWRSLGLALERSGSSSEAAAAYSEYLQRAPTGPQADMVRQRMQAMGH